MKKRIRVFIAICVILGMCICFNFQSKKLIKSYLEQSNKLGLEVEAPITYAKVCAGKDYVVILAEDGRVWTWGTNTNGQLGVGSYISKYQPTRVRTTSSTLLAYVSDIAVGDGFAVAVTAAGNVYSWGVNTSGQLGLGDTTNRVYATKIESITNAVGVACGANHTLIAKNDGTVLTFGDNTNGQLGCGTTVASTTPVVMTGVSLAVKVVAGNGYSIILNNDGTVDSCGKNLSGQLGTGNTTQVNVVTPVKKSGTETLGMISNVISGDSHCVALDQNGLVYVWGDNTYGQLGIGINENLSYATAVAQDTINMGTVANTTYIAQVLDDGNGGQICVWFATGQGNLGQVGNNRDINVNTFTMVENIEKEYFSVFIDRFIESPMSNTALGIAYTGEVYGWGNNNITDKLLLKNNSIYDSPIKVGNEGERFRKIRMRLNGEKSITIGQDDYLSSVNVYNTTLVTEAGALVGEESGVSVSTMTCENGAEVEMWIEVNNNIVKTISGEDYTMFLKDDGTVWSLGKNNNGQLGIGTNDETNQITQVRIDEETYLTGIIDISAGKDTSAAVTEDGLVYTWGNNDSGQLGLGDTTNRNYATQVTISRFATNVSCGENHILILAENGTVYACGDNTYGQLGDGTVNSTNVPVLMEDTSYIIKVIASKGFSVLLKASGVVLTCGRNTYGQLGNGTTDNRSNIESVLYNDNVAISQITNIAVGENHVMGLDINGIVFEWGDNQYGQLSQPEGSNYTYAIAVVSNAINIAANRNTSYVIADDNKVCASGMGSNGQIGNNINESVNQFTEVQDINGLVFETQIWNIESSVFSNTIYAVTTLGDVYGWGNNNSQYKLLFGDEENYSYAKVLGNTRDIYRKILLKEGDTKQLNIIDAEQISDFVLFNTNVELTKTYSIDSNEIATVDESGLVTAVLRGNTGGLIAYSNGMKILINVEIKDRITKIVSGGNTTAILKEDGTVWTWGDNQYGQLGDGTFTDSIKLVQVKKDETLFLTDVRDIAMGEGFVGAVTKEGELYTWGKNVEGQLGIGSYENKIYATLNSEVGSVNRVSTGGRNMQAINEDGTVYSFGDNTCGQLGDGTTTSTNVPVKILKARQVDKVAAGTNHTILLNRSGEVLSCGNNTYGQLGNNTLQNSTIVVPVINEDGQNIINIKDIATGANHNIALTNEGIVYSWGDNQYGQLGTTDNVIKMVATQSAQNISQIGNTANTSYYTNATTNQIYTVGLGTTGQIANNVNENVNTEQIAEDKNGAEFITNVNQIVSSNSSNSAYIINDLGETYGWGKNSTIYKLLLKKDESYNYVVLIDFDGSQNVELEYVKFETEEIPVLENGRYEVMTIKKYDNEEYAIEIKTVKEGATINLIPREEEIYSGVGLLQQSVEIPEDVIEMTIEVVAIDGETKGEYILVVDKELYLTTETYRLTPSVYYDSTNKVNLFTDEEFKRFKQNDTIIMGLSPNQGTSVPGTTVETLKNNTVTNSNATFKVFDLKGVEITDDAKLVGSGMTIQIVKGEETINLTAIVKGDINGDGKLMGTDISMLNASVRNSAILGTEAKQLAVDVDLLKGYVRAVDSSKMRRAFQVPSGNYMK